MSLTAGICWMFHKLKHSCKKKFQNTCKDCIQILKSYHFKVIKTRWIWIQDVRYLLFNSTNTFKAQNLLKELVVNNGKQLWNHHRLKNHVNCTSFCAKTPQKLKILGSEVFVLKIGSENYDNFYYFSKLFCFRNYKYFSYNFGIWYGPKCSVLNDLTLHQQDTVLEPMFIQVILILVLWN